MDAEATRVGPYVLIRELGRGGMSTVYEARHAELGKRVALKMLAQDIAHNPVARERFAREGRAAVRIRHPNVVDVTDVGVCEGAPYLVLELVEGTTLAALFGAGPLPLPRLVELFLPIVSAMRRAHAVGVVHRDLKPANVFLTRDLRGELVPKVGDFGISKLSAPGEVELTREHGAVGTLAYMSPEQIRAAAMVDGRTDQWAIGAMLHQGATGKPPFSFESPTELMHAILHVDPSPPSQFVPVPRAFDRLVQRLLARDPDDRYPDMHAVGAALLELAEGRAWADWAREFGEAAGATEDTTVDATPAAAHTARPTTRAHAPETPRGRIVSVTLAIATLAAGAWVVRSRRPLPSSTAGVVGATVVSTSVAASHAPPPASVSLASSVASLPAPASALPSATSKPRASVAPAAAAASPAPPLGANGAPILE